MRALHSNGRYKKLTMTNVLFGLFIVLSAHWVSAESRCLNYNEDGVVMTGKVMIKTFFGPPNYGENPSTDSKETQAILKLDQPVCTNADPKNDEEAEAGLTEITLVPMQKINFRSYANKRIRVTGNLFHAFTGHHHTSVLISVTEMPRVIH